MGTLNRRCRIIIGTPKGTIILKTTPHFLIWFVGAWAVAADSDGSLGQLVRLERVPREPNAP